MFQPPRVPVSKFQTYAARCGAVVFAASLLGIWGLEASLAQAQVKASHDVQNMIEEAYKAHKPSVTIPPGVYVVQEQGRRAHIDLKEYKNFEIDADGVTLLMADPTRIGIILSDCRNVTLKGITLSYATSPSTQGVVVGIAPDGKSYDIKIDKGWPTNLDDSAYFKENPIAYLFDPKTRWWKKGAADLYASGKPQKLAPDTFRVTWKKPLGPPDQPVALGDLVAFRGGGKQMIAVEDSAEMRFDHVTILRGAGMGIRENGGDGDNHYNALTIKRSPRMNGETTDPLLSVTADGFHSLNVRHGPTVENSFIEATPDDGIAITGFFSMVFQSVGSQLIIGQNKFRAGDPVQLLDPEGVPVGDAKVVSVAPTKFQATGKSERGGKKGKGQMQGPFFLLTLDKPLQGGFDYLVANPLYGSGYVVRNTTIAHNRARGMILKAQDGLIEHNVVDGSTMSALVMAPELSWNEAGYSRNVMVRDNTFKNCPVVSKTIGVVSLFALSDDGNDKDAHHPIAGYGHQNIVFQNNHFTNNDGPNLVITSARNVLVKGNVFSHDQNLPEEARGASWGEDSGALINIAASTDVVLSGNTVIAPGKENYKLVKVLDGAQVTGADSGIRLVKQ